MATSSTRTRRDVVPFASELSFAVKFLSSQLVQQTLVLVLLMRHGCPLQDKVCSAANTVALMA